MKELFLLVLAAGSSFLLVVSVAASGVRKKNRRLLFLAAFLFIAGSGLAGRASYVLLYKAKNKIATTWRPRTGSEIYEALFGQGPAACTQVVESQDQVVPRIDTAIWLHFHTCPGEFKRLLARHQFEGGKEPTAQWSESIPGAENMKWFRPQAMGDTIVVYEYATENSRNIQTFWASRDSTEVFYRDIAD
ncbi:hypothetical protein GO988_04405 [Hymenobacter sp. HMF4947]|uniref:Uncharacterized protein n=1 Tax=Hymenobacter ginkgonis TaxID=2682976 RepID=A0A7K1TBK5_9BACT|nr:hypothetical protein [Hymenobacter ginkgonis]MVN75561.1 hypothetical protein [Hymenobacter ginkgonis]